MMKRFVLAIVITFSLVACASGNQKPKPLLLSNNGKLSTELQEYRPNYESSYASRPQVQKFIKMMVKKHKYDEALLQAAFSSVKARKNAIKKSNSQPEVVTPYYRYRQNFLENERILAGRKFLKENEFWLKKAQSEFGVPAEVIVALIGVETFYGKVMGNIDVFTSLSTLAFDYPRRDEYFQSELEAYLLLVRDNEWPIGNAKGSYSGALGMTQFMPSNYRKLAVDYDGNGVVDLWHSAPDAIGSVANYLSRHGWQTGQEVVNLVNVEELNNKKWKPHVNNGRSPIKSLPEWQSIGVAKDFNGQIEIAGLIALRTDTKNTTYWLANKNFFVIMKYNPSRRYSMAVLELAKEISR